jgi:hypothetical protein
VWAAAFVSRHAPLVDVATAAAAAAAASGLILTPLMLELGVHPAVSVASSQITMLIGNSTSAIVYAVSVRALKYHQPSNRSSDTIAAVEKCTHVSISTKSLIGHLHVSNCVCGEPKLAP